jgi:hypothetical protein
MDGPGGQTDNDRKGKLLCRFRKHFRPGNEQKRPGSDEDQPPGAYDGNKIRPGTCTLFTQNSDGRRQRKYGNKENSGFSAGGY